MLISWTIAKISSHNVYTYTFVQYLFSNGFRVLLMCGNTVMSSGVTMHKTLHYYTIYDIYIYICMYMTFSLSQVGINKFFVSKRTGTCSFGICNRNYDDHLSVLLRPFYFFLFSDVASNNMHEE